MSQTHERKHESKSETRRIPTDELNALYNQEPHKAEETKKPSRRGFLAAGVGLTALAVIGGGAYGAKELLSKEAKPEPTPTPEPMPTTTEAPTEAPVETTYGIQQDLDPDAMTQAFEIKPGLSTEDYANAVANNLSAYENYGCAKKLQQGFQAIRDKQNGYDQQPFNDLITKTADEHLPPFVKAMTGKTLDELDDTTKNFFVNMRDANMMCMWIFMKTDDKRRDDEQFTEWLEVDSVEELTNYDGAPNTKRMAIDLLQKSNSDKNRANELDPKGDYTPDGKPLRIIIGVEDTNDATYLRSVIPQPF